MHLGVANNMHPLSWGGTNGKDPNFFKISLYRQPCCGVREKFLIKNFFANYFKRCYEILEIMQAVKVLPAVKINL